MLAAGLFVSGKSYYCQHYPSRERWVILGISKDFKKVCVAGWPPTIANANDCELWEVAKDLTEKELEYRQKEFGSGWI
jgi:hypothetical protein